jgi:hypothetical protein
MPGVLGIEGTDGKLGILTPGISGKLLVALFTMTNPTPAAIAMNTTAPIPSTIHGMPADDFRGGWPHGAP